MAAVTAPNTVTTARLRIATTAEKASTDGRSTISEIRMLPPEKGTVRKTVDLGLA